MQEKTDSWIREYEKKQALWIHDNNPKRPHALLTSGNHSSGFFNSEPVMEDPISLENAALALVTKMKDRFNIVEIDRVVGPAMGAITLAHDIARIVGMARKLVGIDSCLRAYTEKETSSAGQLMVFKRSTIRKGERVLLVEDVITTGGSINLTTSAVESAGGNILPFVITLVNRSSLRKVSGKTIIALIDHPMQTWTPDECPLCKWGSEAIRPKGSENWARLNTSY